MSPLTELKNKIKKVLYFSYNLLNLIVTHLKICYLSWMFRKLLLLLQFELEPIKSNLTYCHIKSKFVIKILIIKLKFYSSRISHVEITGCATVRHLSIETRKDIAQKGSRVNFLLCGTTTREVCDAHLCRKLNL